MRAEHDLKIGFDAEGFFGAHPGSHHHENG
jgi:hypothetical protein